MLQNIRLQTRILAGFSLLIAVLLVVGLVGVSGVSRLGDDLTFVLGPAWNTADGAMESSIEIEAQMLAIAGILRGRDPEQALQQLEDAKNSAAEATERMASAGLIPGDMLDPFNRLNEQYAEQITALLERFSQFQSALINFQDNSRELVAFGEVLEELGDQAVEDIEANPDEAQYWNLGLRERWMAADGGMEANIGLLRQLYFLQRLLNGDTRSEVMQQLQQAMAFQEEASSEMFSSGRFDGSAGPNYGNQSYRAVYDKLFNQHKTLMTQVIDHYQAYQSAALSYEQTADQLLKQLVEIEEVADATVEDTIISSKETRSQSEWAMEVALGIGVILSIAFAWLLKVQIMGSLTVFKQRIDDLVQGDGDLSRRLNLKRGDEFGILADSLDRFFDKIHNLVKGVAESAPKIAQSTHELLSTADQTGQGIEEQRAQTEQISAAVYEMDETAQHVAENIESASNQAGEANTNTQAVHESLREATASIERLGEQIDENVSVIGSLNEAVGNINSVVEVITGIAEQTNLLALNAAIEAARAGEQGRGFAVVADEVRGLAARTQDSTGEIRRMINELRDKATEAVKSMDASRTISEGTTEKARQSMETLSRISTLISDLSAFNQQVASAAFQQSQTTRSLGESVHSIKNIAERNSAQMTQTLVVGRELEKVGMSLEKQVRQFKL